MHGNLYGMAGVIDGERSFEFRKNKINEEF